KPLFVKFGLNHTIAVIEAKKASLVVIVHNVDPIELAIFLPVPQDGCPVRHCILPFQRRRTHAVSPLILRPGRCHTSSFRDVILPSSRALAPLYTVPWRTCSALSRTSHATPLHSSLSASLHLPLALSHLPLAPSHLPLAPLHSPLV
ncbi:hypothetical protein B0H11DRAFT_1747600, partial [Mycena galericulata]